MKKIIVLLLLFSFILNLMKIDLLSYNYPNKKLDMENSVVINNEDVKKLNKDLDIKIVLVSKNGDGNTKYYTNLDCVENNNCNFITSFGNISHSFEILDIKNYDIYGSSTEIYYSDKNFLYTLKSLDIDYTEGEKYYSNYDYTMYTNAPTLYAMLLILFMIGYLVYLYIENKKKYICSLFFEGYSKTQIVKKLVGKISVLFILLSLLINISSTSIYFSHFELMLVKMQITNILFPILYLLFITLTILYTYTKMSYNQVLKGQKNSKFMHTILVITKILTIVITLFIADNILEAIQGLEYYKGQQEFSEVTKDLSYTKIVSSTNGKSLEYEEQKNVVETFYNNSLEYEIPILFDFRSNTDGEDFLESCTSNCLFISNKSYLNLFEIYDSDGNLINSNEIKTTTLLYPENMDYMNIDLYEYDINKIKTIPIKSNQTIHMVNINDDWYEDNSQVSVPLLLIDETKLNSEYLLYLMSNGHIYYSTPIEKLVKFTEDLKVSNTLKFKQASSEFDNSIRQLIKKLRISLIINILALFTFIIVAISTIIQFFEQNKKLIITKKLNGYLDITIYKKYLFNSIISYLVVFYIFNNITHNTVPFYQTIIMILGMLLLEIITFYIINYLVLNKKINNFMKGMKID